MNKLQEKEELLVGIDVVAVPDGVIQNGPGTTHTLRLSLVLSFTEVIDGCTKIDLAKWPLPLNSVLDDGLKIHIGKRDPSDGALVEDSIQTLSVDGGASALRIIAKHDQGELQSANKLFHKIFQGRESSKEPPEFSGLHDSIVSQAQVAKAGSDKPPVIQKLSSPYLTRFYKQQLAAMLSSNVDGTSREQSEPSAKFDIDELTPSIDFWEGLKDQINEQKLRFDNMFFAPGVSVKDRDSVDLIEQVEKVYLAKCSSEAFDPTDQAPEAWYMELRIPQLINEIRQNNAQSIAPASRAPTTKELAEYKLFGVYSYPSLAKFLGLIVDVEFEIPADLWPDTASDEWVLAGTLQAEEGSICKDAIWSAFELGGLENPSFYPKPHPDPSLGEGYFSNNVINLNVVTPLNEPRFWLESLDLQASPRSLIDQLESVVAKSGNVHIKVDKSIPEIFDRGIGFFDGDIDNQIKRQDDRDQALREAANNGKLVVKYAEDLMTGRRLMIKVSREDDVTKGKWMPANNRNHTFTEIPKEYRLKIAGYSSRDNGQVEDPTQTVTSKMSDVSDLIVSWMGEGLSLPAETGTVPVGSDGINTDLTVEAKETQMPPLREGLYYQFGAYPVYINGGSIDFTDAANIIEESNYGLGSQQGPRKAYHYVRSASLKSPTILIDPRDKYIGEGKNSHNDTGDSAETLILRKGSDFISRFIVPPAVNFDIAEQGSAFDDSDEETPPGSFFRGQERLMMSSVSGTDASFPILSSEGSIHDASSQTDVKSRGLVYVKTTNAARSSKDYFPDPAVKGINLRLVRKSDMRLLAEASNIGYYENDHVDISKARSWNLRVKKWGGSSERVSIDSTNRKITVFVAPAEELLMLIYSQPVDGIRRTLLSMMEEGVSERLLNSNSFVDGLHRYSELKLVYPVRTPLKQPIINARSFKAVVIRNEDSSSWSDYIADPLNYEDGDIWNWSKLRSEESGGKTFFVGDIEVDRNSTQNVRVEFTWHQFAQVKKTGDKYIEQFIPNENSVFINDVQPFSDSNLGDVSLVYEDAEAKNLRVLNFDFVDPTAKQLTVKAVALSRFRQNFEGREDDNRKDADYEADSSSIKIWVLATKRPDKVKFASSVDLENTFLLKENYAEVDAARAGVKHFERKCSSYRVWLDDWNSASEEKLAVLLWQGGEMSSELDTTFQNGDGNGAPTDVVTRWAADPIVLSGSLNDLVDINRFSNFELRENLSIPGRPKDLRVSALVYQVKFSSEYGKWYADIDFEPAASYHHWLHLSLARYQEHSVEGLELSEPVSEKIWWPSSFSGEAITKGRGRNSSVSILLDGVGYKKKAPISQSLSSENPEYQTKLNVPILRLSYMVKDSEREPAEDWSKVLEEGQIKYIEEIEPSTYNNDLVRWQYRFDKTDWPAHDNVGVLLEVLDYHPLPEDVGISPIVRYQQLIKLR